MFSVAATLLIAAIAFVIGILIGVLANRTLASPGQQKELEKSLQEARNDMEKYQQNVAEHFVETSQRISNLTESYRDLHEHLAKGAMSLTTSEVSQQVLQAGDNPSLADDSLLNTDFTPPKDWAPKTPGQTGILSEEFGLTEDKEEPGIEVTSLQHNKSSKDSDAS